MDSLALGDRAALLAAAGVEAGDVCSHGPTLHPTGGTVCAGLWLAAVYWARQGRGSWPSAACAHRPTWPHVRTPDTVT